MVGWVRVGAVDYTYPKQFLGLRSYLPEYLSKLIHSQVRNLLEKPFSVKYSLIFFSVQKDASLT